MAEYVATISSKGQVTIPADIRKKLGVGAADKIAFMFTEDKKIEIRPVRYTLESVIVSLGALPSELADLDWEIEQATEEARVRKFGGCV